jgi:rhodanese-related sulfurtransferase
MLAQPLDDEPPEMNPLYADMDDARRPLDGTTQRSARPCRRREWLRLAAMATLAPTLAASIAACGQEDSPLDAVSLETARAELEAGRAVLIDIREPDEHATGVAAGAKLLPMQQLKQRIQEIPNSPEQPVLLICHTQGRSSATLQVLRAQGYGHVRYVSGGMSEWARRGWPMVKPPAGGPGT